MQPARLGAWMRCLVSTVLLVALVALPSYAQTVETSQETNDRIRSIAAASQASPARDYVIGGGDVLAIQVFDVPELTELQAELKIAEVLEANGLVSHPEVSVSVKERKSKPITVVGAVIHPMVYQADRQVTLLDVLAEAGGITPDAGESVIVTRAETDPSDDATPPPISPQDVAPTPLPADSAAAPAPSKPFSPSSAEPLADSTASAQAGAASAAMPGISSGAQAVPPSPIAPLSCARMPVASNARSRSISRRS